MWFNTMEITITLCALVFSFMVVNFVILTRLWLDNGEMNMYSVFINLFVYNFYFEYWPAPSSIQRGLEWTQFLKRLFSVCLSVCSLSPNFLIFPSFILLFLYSTVQKSAVQ